MGNEAGGRYAPHEVVDRSDCNFVFGINRDAKLLPECFRSNLAGKLQLRRHIQVEVDPSHLELARIVIMEPSIFNLLSCQK